jgi:hypothetical protein
LAKTAATKRKALANATTVATQESDTVATPSTPASQSQVDSPARVGVGFSPGAVGRSVAAAMAPLFAQQSAKKLRLKAAPGDLSAPRWPGELEVASQPDKLALFEAARVKYVATCAITEHVPTPLHEAFDVLLVPTLRR